MRPKAKYHVIYRHREEYPVSVMCGFFGVSRSGYYAFVQRLGRPEPDGELAEMIKDCQTRCGKTYGYRRVWLWLKQQDICRNPKTVLRVMKKYGLLSEIRRRRKWVQMGQQIHRYENLLNRQFRADRLNSKWVTDISYIDPPYNTRAKDWKYNNDYVDPTQIRKIGKRHSRRIDYAVS